MKLLLTLCLSVVSLAAWSQRDRSDGEPSPAVREQQRQADYARKQHPKSSKPKPQEASIRTKDGKKPVRAKPGEASLKH